MKKFLAALLSILLFLHLIVIVLPVEAGAASGDDSLALYAQSAVLMDADTGRILYAKNAEEQRPMASTTKIMTLILALENANPDDIVTVSDYAASMPDVQLHLRAGEHYRLGDLLYSMMLESHNDSAVAIAEHVAGTVPAFAVLMNAKARDIGFRFQQADDALRRRLCGLQFREDAGNIAHRLEEADGVVDEHGQRADGHGDAENVRTADDAVAALPERIRRRQRTQRHDDGQKEV